jgi:hypothetical protein
VNGRLSSLLVLVGLAYAQEPASSEPLVAHDATHQAAGATVVKQAGTLASPDVPPLPAGKPTLLGGTIQKVDHVRDRLVLEVFGGDRTSVLFDERTHVFRDGTPASLDDLKTGQRAYVDTTLDGTNIFARNIRIAGKIPTGQSSGQIVDFQPNSGELMVRDLLSTEPIKMRLATGAVILHDNRPARPSELQRGALVTLAFTPGNSGPPIVQRVSILASPGSAFVFLGRIEHLDFHRGILVLIDPRDNKSYEIYFDPAARRLSRDLRIGATVTVQASFNGSRYEGHDIAVNAAITQ